MKVLWVCNMVLPVIAQRLGLEVSHKEGWLSGLCESILERREENQIELHVAFPISVWNAEEGRNSSPQVIPLPEYGPGTVLYGYGFYEDLSHAENYDPQLEVRIKQILEQVSPDVVHCFGTEYGHALALLRCCPEPEKVLVGIQGLCQVIAGSYLADLPQKVCDSVTFRDWLKKDSIRMQQQKFYLRGQREKEILQLTRNVAGRTRFDCEYTRKENPTGRYFLLNETLRSCFYEGQWDKDSCEPHTIFMSQGDYPLKGLHYMLLAAGKLREKYPDTKIKIAGNSLVNYRTIKDKIKLSAYGKYLRRLIREGHLENKVEFLGRLTGQQMKEQYLKAGLYVCCSSNENSPNSLGEAMLLGVPCVAADVGGIPSIFTGGVDGILYEGFRPGTDTFGSEAWKEAVERKNGVGTAASLERVVGNLAEAVEKMWEDPEAMQEYCENARKHAKVTHDREANYQAVLDIYAEIK